MSTVSLPAKQFLSVGEAAKVLGCTTGRIRQMLRAAELEGVKLNERAWAVYHKSVVAVAKKTVVRGRPRIGA